MEPTDTPTVPTEGELTPTECARVLRALADPTRLRILSALRGGPLPVCEIVDRLGIPQYAASRHLGALLGLGLLVRERRQRRVYYGLGEAVAGDAAATVELGCCRFSVP